MVGRTPSNVMVVRPLRDGVISEFDVTQIMLEYFIGKVHEQSVVPLPRPRVVIGIPTGVTEVEKRAVYDATMAAGARQAFLEEPIAAALGAGLPIGEIRGQHGCGYRWRHNRSSRFVHEWCRGFSLPARCRR